jgi:transcriptional repressor NrdR
MKCPFCEDSGTRVLDSRVAKKGEQIRRRRECPACGQRFTTYERAETGLPTVVKKDEGRVPFDRDKLRTGIVRATWKRSLADREIEDFLDKLEQKYRNMGHREISTRQIGDDVLRFLQTRDQIAYIRFMSVYGDFSDSREFIDRLLALEANGLDCPE